MKQKLKDLLKTYEWMWTRSGWNVLTEESIESVSIRRFHDLLDTLSDPFARASLPGHVTGSALIVNSDRTQVLLTHHKKLGRWLQLGGHVDPGEWVFQAALREAKEESGLPEISPVFWAVEGEAVPWDIDIHPIPQSSKEPAHEHFDVRFLFVTPQPERIVRSDESNDLKWFAVSELLAQELEPSMKRQLVKLTGVATGSRV